MQVKIGEFKIGNRTYDIMLRTEDLLSGALGKVANLSFVREGNFICNVPIFDEDIYFNTDEIRNILHKAIKDPSLSEEEYHTIEKEFEEEIIERTKEILSFEVF